MPAPSVRPPGVRGKCDVCHTDFCLAGMTRVPERARRPRIPRLRPGRRAAERPRARRRSRSRRRDPSPGDAPDSEDDEALGASHRGLVGIMERETGFVPATLGYEGVERPKSDGSSRLLACDGMRRAAAAGRQYVSASPSVSDHASYLVPVRPARAPAPALPDRDGGALGRRPRRRDRLLRPVAAPRGRLQQTDPAVSPWDEGAMTRFERITSEPERMNGQPCIRSPRLAVRRVLEALALYPDREALRREYPALEDRLLALPRSTRGTCSIRVSRAARWSVRASAESRLCTSRSRARCSARCLDPHLRPRRRSRRRDAGRGLPRPSHAIGRGSAVGDSVIRLRIHRATAELVTGRVVAVLDRCREDLENGAMISTKGVRVRRLVATRRDERRARRTAGRRGAATSRAIPRRRSGCSRRPTPLRRNGRP